MPARRGRPCSCSGSPRRSPPCGCGPRRSPVSVHAPGPCLRRDVGRRALGNLPVPGAGPRLAAFLSSSAFLLGMVATALVGQLPVLAAVDARPLLQPHRLQCASRRGYAMGVALTWWAIGIILVAGYFAYLFRSIRGKVERGFGSRLLTGLRRGRTTSFHGVLSGEGIRPLTGDVKSRTVPARRSPRRLRQCPLGDQADGTAALHRNRLHSVPQGGGRGEGRWRRGEVEHAADTSAVDDRGGGRPDALRLLEETATDRSRRRVRATPSACSPKRWQCG